MEYSPTFTVTNETHLNSCLSENKSELINISTTETIASTISKFHFDPVSNLIFKEQFRHNKDIFSNGIIWLNSQSESFASATQESVKHNNCNNFTL